MTDNIRVAPSLNGSDPLVATDDIAGVQYQKIKLGWGADGVWTETTDTDGLRVPVGGAQIGGLTETAPGTDTASSGLNGRLQRIAQRLTALIAQIPATLGQKTMAASLSGHARLGPASESRHGHVLAGHPTRQRHILANHPTGVWHILAGHAARLWDRDGERGDQRQYGGVGGSDGHGRGGRVGDR